MLCLVSNSKTNSLGNIAEGEQAWLHQGVQTEESDTDFHTPQQDMEPRPSQFLHTREKQTFLRQISGDIWRLGCGLCELGTRSQMRVKCLHTCQYGQMKYRPQTLCTSPLQMAFLWHPGGPWSLDTILGIG